MGLECGCTHLAHMGGVVRGQCLKVSSVHHMVSVAQLWLTGLEAGSFAHSAILSPSSWLLKLLLRDTCYGFDRSPAIEELVLLFCLFQYTWGD